jgi:hypothetical protein
MLIALHDTAHLSCSCDCYTQDLRAQGREGECVTNKPTNVKQSGSRAAHTPTHPTLCVTHCQPTSQPSLQLTAAATVKRQ